MTEKNKVSFLNSGKANLIDMFIVLILSTAVLFFGDILLRFTLGMYVSDLKGMLLILIIIVTIVYNTIMQGSKEGATLGQRLSGIYLKSKDN